MRDAECGTDHMLILDKLKLRIIRRFKSRGIKLYKRINLLKLRDSKIQVNLRNVNGEVEFNATWTQFKINVGVKVLGLKNRKHRD